eukprot:gene34022-biopygen4049
MVHSSERRAFLVTNLLGMKTWLSTDQGHRRGIRHLQRHMAEFLDYGLPATEVDVRGYVAYAVELRPFRLDSSSVSTYLAGVSKWHAKVAWLVRQAGIVDSSDQPVKVHNPCRHYLVVELLVVLDKRNKQVSQAKSAWTLAEWKCICMSGFDITTRSGLHHGLVFVFCTFGCLRKGATEFGRVLFDLIYGERGVSIQWKSPPDPYESLVLVVYNDEELSPLGILQIHDIKDDTTNYVMYLQTALYDFDLENCVRLYFHGRMPICMMKDVSRQLLGALEEIHQHGVLHGDLKAENVFSRLTKVNNYNSVAHCINV